LKARLITAAMGRQLLTLPAKPPQRLITVVHYPYARRAGCSALRPGMNFIRRSGQQTIGERHRPTDMI
jgi:hypothetical protein